MAQQTINIGASPNDGTGDFVRDAFDKTNDNFTELYDSIVFTVELVDALTIDFYAPYEISINSIDNVLNSPTITIQDDGVAYTLGNTIATGSKITVTVSTASVVNLNITK